jgi:propanol-preferring alcohol dehydrogenase
MQAFQIVTEGQPLASVEILLADPGAGEVRVSIEAAGICRSDVHYLSGTRPAPQLPLVPGHEIAGSVDAVGPGVDTHAIGDRVCLHYLVTCGTCGFCLRGAEQFCETGQMLGLDRQGGYAEAIVVPARNAHHIPDEVSTEAAAVMMCSSSTSLHALRRADIAPGMSVGVFGAGGLGMSAIQIAQALGAGPVLAIDINPVKLKAAQDLGAVPIDGNGDVIAAIHGAVPAGIDVGLELVGSADLMRTIVGSLAPGGRAVAVGITHREFGLDPYRDLIKREASIIGAADHFAAEIDELLGMAASGTIDPGQFITNRIGFDLGEVNRALDRLAAFGDDIRTVIFRS